MVNQYIWIGIVVGVFFVGMGISYGIFVNSYDPTIKFQNQQQFDQMMANNPTMSTEWRASTMEGGMMRQMMMGSSPAEEHEMMLEIIETMQENENLMNHMFAHMMNDERVIHNMLTIMTKAPHLKDHMAAHVSGDLSEYAYLDEGEHEEHIHDDGR